MGYLPGKKQVLADTLSRASLNKLQVDEDEIQVNVLERISISEPKYTELQQKTANELYAMIQTGWPETKQQVPHSILEYWESRDELAVLHGVIYRGMKIVVPVHETSHVCLDTQNTPWNCEVQTEGQGRALLAWNECSNRRQSKRLYHVPQLRVITWYWLIITPSTLK